jgi:hypothetical protein
MTPLNNIPNFSVVFDKVSFVQDCKNGVLISATVAGQSNQVYSYRFINKSIDSGELLITPENGQFAMSNNSIKLFTTVYPSKIASFVICCSVTDGINTAEALTTVVCQT